MDHTRTTHANYVNVAEPERWVSVIGGGALIAYGLTRKSWNGIALAALGGGMVQRGVTGHCMMYRALGIHTAERSLGVGVPYELGIRVDQAVTINRPVGEVYAFWRNLENLPRFMNNLECVAVRDERHSHWVAKGPAGRRFEWDAEIINDIENEVIGWRSLPGSDVDSGGSVRFERAPGGRGTEVRVSLQYNPPGGSVGAAFAKLIGQDPKKQIQDDLRRFKHLVEAGEIPTTAGQPTGRNAKNLKESSESIRSQQSDRFERIWPANDAVSQSPANDAVSQSSEESFPASDSPSWTPEKL